MNTILNVHLTHLLNVFLVERAHLCTIACDSLIICFTWHGLVSLLVIGHYCSILHLLTVFAPLERSILPSNCAVENVFVWLVNQWHSSHSVSSVFLFDTLERVAFTWLRCLGLIANSELLWVIICEIDALVICLVLKHDTASTNLHRLALSLSQLFFYPLLCHQEQLLLHLLFVTLLFLFSHIQLTSFRLPKFTCYFSFDFLAFAPLPIGASWRRPPAHRCRLKLLAAFQTPNSDTL